MQSPQFRDYNSFWYFYLSQHSKSATRFCHVVGTLGGCCVAFSCAALGLWSGILIALLVGYIPAWFSHFFIEKNKPATFGNPVWSFVSDFRMAYLMLTGTLQQHLKLQENADLPSISRDKV